jgi:hypothetical protein
LNRKGAKDAKVIKLQTCKLRSFRVISFFLIFYKKFDFLVSTCRPALRPEDMAPSGQMQLNDTGEMGKEDGERGKKIKAESLSPFLPSFPLSPQKILCMQLKCVHGNYRQSFVDGMGVSA